MNPTLTPYGDHALLVNWPTDGFSEGVNDAVHALSVQLRESGKYVEVVPGYDSVLCVFDLGERTFDDAKRHVEDVLASNTMKKQETGQLIDIPVHYGGQDGPDMQRICASAKMTEDAVITLQSGQIYRVCMMGFIPGFSFLSPAPKALHHPRFETPRPKVPAGSIGIANWQTGIYGLESPGGWQIIGRTESVMFDAKRDKPFLVKAGDRVRFVPS